MLQITSTIRILILFLCFVFPANIFAQQNIKLNQVYLDLQTKIQADPSNQNLKMDLAYLLTQGLAYDEAVKIYAEVLKTDSKNLRATIELCAMLTEMRRGPEALVYCENAIKLKPNQPVLWDNLGLHHFKFAAYDKAIPAFLQAKTLSPDSLLIEQHIGQTLLAAGDAPGAQHYLEKIIQNHKNPRGEQAAALQYALHLTYKNQKLYGPSLESIWLTYLMTGNDLYWIQIVKAWMAKYQRVSFLIVSSILLLFADYLGKRLNRFLKNED